MTYFRAKVQQNRLWYLNCYSSFNLTNHFNPEAVHANTGDPAFGYFFGHRGRRFTVDFDVLF